jgi:hypothetical protein
VTAALAARDVWARKHPATVALSRDQRACAAMREIERLREAIIGLQREFNSIKYRDDIPCYQMNSRERLLLGWAKDDLASTQTELEAILKE